MNKANKTIEVWCRDEGAPGGPAVLKNLCVELYYPSINTAAENTQVEISLFHVRASGSLFVTFDGGRNGWVVARYPCPKREHDCLKHERVEVGFFPAHHPEADE